MSKFLKGNFDVKQPPESPKAKQDLLGRFETEALDRLGGRLRS